MIFEQNSSPVVVPSTYRHRRQIHEDAAAALTPGQAALCLMIRKVTADKVIPAMAPFGGTVLRTNLSDEQEARLQAALKAV